MSLSAIKEELYKLLSESKKSHPNYSNFRFTSNVEWLRYLCGSFIVDWSYSFSTEELEELYFPLFVGNKNNNILPIHDAPTILQFILSSFPTSVNVKDTEIIELHQNRLKEILILWIDKDSEQIISFLDFLFSKTREKNVQDQINLHKEEIMCLLSLPTKIANIFQQKTPEIFDSNNFLPILIHQIVQFIINHKEESPSYYSGISFNILGKYCSLYPRDRKY